MREEPPPPEAPAGIRQQKTAPTSCLCPGSGSIKATTPRPAPRPKQSHTERCWCPKPSFLSGGSEIELLSTQQRLLGERGGASVCRGRQERVMREGEKRKHPVNGRGDQPSSANATCGSGLSRMRSSGLWASVHVCVDICASLGAEHVWLADFGRMEQQMEGWCNSDY